MVDDRSWFIKKQQSRTGGYTKKTRSRAPVCPVYPTTRIPTDVSFGQPGHVWPARVSKGEHFMGLSAFMVHYKIYNFPTKNHGFGVPGCASILVIMCYLEHPYDHMSWMPGIRLLAGNGKATPWHAKSDHTQEKTTQPAGTNCITSTRMEPFHVT